MAGSASYGPLAEPPPPLAQPAPLDRDLAGFYVELPDAPYPFPVAVQFARTPDGLPYATGVLVGWDEPRVEITARALRGIRLGEILGGIVELPDKAATPQGRLVAEETLRSAIRNRPRRPGPGGYPAEHYEQVAALYRQAVEVSPRSPVKWMAAELPASLATVHRWLAVTRDRGLLEKTKSRGPSTARTTTRRSKR